MEAGFETNAMATEGGERPVLEILSPIKVIDGNEYMKSAKGSLVPLETVRAQDKLEDEMVRKVAAFAQDLSDQIARFRGHCYEDIAAHLALLDQEYQANPVGEKGNVSFTSYDGCMKVSLQVSELVRFGPELQSAKKLVDACLAEWSADAQPQIRAVIDRAFSDDTTGEVRQANLFALLRLDIEDERWTGAMRALKDAIRVIGSKEYIRFYKRESSKEKWRAITIDMAKAGS